MNAFTATAICNVCLMALIGFSVWFTKSPWPLVALIFMLYTKSRKSGDDEEEDE